MNNYSQKSRQIVTRLGLIMLLSLALLAALTLRAPRAQAATCAGGEVGSVTSSAFTVSTTNADSYKLWLQLKGAGTATVGIELDGLTCQTQQVNNLNSTWVWSGIGSSQAVAAGTHTMKIKVYSSGVSMLGGVLINDGCVPTGDSTNCSTQTPAPTTTITVVPTTTTVPTVTSAPPPTTIAPPPVQPVTLQSGTWNDSLLTYSIGWNIANNAAGENKYLADDHWSNSTGATVKFNFKGDSVTIYSALQSWHGIAEVVLDNQAPVTIDLYSPTRKDTVSVFSAQGLSTTDTHTITMKVLGTKNAASSGTIVTIDKVVIGQIAPPTTIAPPPTTVTPPPTTTVTPPPGSKTGGSGATKY
ncbi:MAG: hypothetical protein WCI47_03585 [bacterium]